MSTWYRAYYGTWNDPEGVRSLPGTFDRKAAFAKAHEVADRLGLAVTVEARRGSADGLRSTFYKVVPERR
jgi:hypothetical protein